MGTTPNICPVHNTPVFHARRAFGCECETCQGPAEREVEPDAEAERKQREREEQSERIMEATQTTYTGSGGRPREGAGIPEAAAKDVENVLEGDDG